MRRILGITGLALAILAGAITYNELGLPDDEPPAWWSVFHYGARPLQPVLSMRLTNSGDLPDCTIDTGCVLDVTATMQSDGGTAMVARTGSGSYVTVNNSTANGFEAAPMVSGGGATVYAATITSTIPQIAAGSVPDDVRTLWASNHTCIFVANARNAASTRTYAGFGDVNEDGFQLLSTSTNTSARWYGAAAAIVLNVSPAGASIDEWDAIALRKNGTSYTICVNGACNSTTDATTVVNPGTDDVFFFGSNPSGAAALNGALQRGRCYSSALSDATIQLRSAQMLKGLAVRPADTYVTTTRASAAFDVYADGYVYASGDNVRIPHSTKGLQSFSGYTNSFPFPMDMSSGTNVGTPTINSNVASGPFSRYAGGAEVDEIVDDDGAAKEGKQFTSSVFSTGDYTVSCMAAAGETGTTKTELQFVFGSAGGGTTTPASCAWADLASGVYTRKSCAVTIGGTPSSFVMTVYNSATAANTGSVRISECEITKTTALMPPAPITTAIAADVHTVPTTGWPTTSGEIALSFTPNVADATANQMLFDSRTTSTTQGVNFYRTTTERIICETWAAANTCQVQSAVLTFTPGTAKTVECRWTPTTCAIVVDGVSVSAAATGSPASHDTAANIGSSVSGALQADGWLKLACVGRPGSCPRRRITKRKRKKRAPKFLGNVGPLRNVWLGKPGACP